LKNQVGKEFIESIPEKPGNRIARLALPEVQQKEAADYFWMNDDNFLTHSDWLEQNFIKNEVVNQKILEIK
jgi:hypothetical protein